MLTLRITSKHLIISASRLITPRVAVAPKNNAMTLTRSLVPRYFGFSDNQNTVGTRGNISPASLRLYTATPDSRQFRVSLLAPPPFFSPSLYLTATSPSLRSKSFSSVDPPGRITTMFTTNCNGFQSSIYWCRGFFHQRFLSACSWLYYRYYDVPELAMLYRSIACIITNNEQWSVTITLLLLFIRLVRSFDGRLLCFFFWNCLDSGIPRSWFTMTSMLDHLGRMCTHRELPRHTAIFSTSKRSHFSVCVYTFRWQAFVLHVPSNFRPRLASTSFIFLSFFFR